MSKVSESIETLRSRPSGLRCSEVVRILSSLGYTVTARKAAHHKVYGHSKTSNYSGGSFSCGHGKNPLVLAVYVKNILAELERATNDLEDFLRQRS